LSKWASNTTYFVQIPSCNLYHIWHYI
jgi:hypothetical protein